MLFSSSHIPCLGSTLSMLCFLHDFFPPFSLSNTGLISLWHIVRLVFRFLFSHLPSSSSLPLSYPTSIFIGSSPGFLVFLEVPTLLNFINLFSISLPFDFNPLTHWRLLPPCYALLVFSSIPPCACLLFASTSLVNLSSASCFPFILEANAMDLSVV